MGSEAVETFFEETILEGKGTGFLTEENASLKERVSALECLGEKYRGLVQTNSSLKHELDELKSETNRLRGIEAEFDSKKTHCEMYHREKKRRKSPKGSMTKSWLISGVDEYSGDEDEDEDEG